MIMAALDVDSVQAFVLVADLGSFTKAASALDTSQAAISVKIKRLEDKMGYRLLDRTPRNVRLSAQGMTFLKPARNLITAHELAVAGLSAAVRRIAIGISDQVAGQGLPDLLQKLNAFDPGLVVEVHIDSTSILMEAFDKETLDAAIVRREDHRPDGELLVQEPFGWFASPQWEYVPEQPLRLASLAKSCGVRNVATRLLDKAGIVWKEVFIGGGTAAIGAAVAAGLAVAPMAYSVAPVGTLDVGKRYGFPHLPDSDVMLHSRVTDPVSKEAIKLLAAAFRSRNRSVSPGGTRKHRLPNHSQERGN
jgi:DNA-binding transcriptional LysR family regulator